MFSLSSRIGLSVVVVTAMMGTVPREEADEGKPVYLALNAGKLVLMEAKQEIASVKVEDEKVVRATIVKRPELPPGLPKPPQNLVHLASIGTGKTVVTLVDADGKKEKLVVVVRREAVVPLEFPILLPSPTSKALKKAKSYDESTVRVEIVKEGSSTVRLIPVAVGRASVDVTDEDGRTEPVEIFVRKMDIIMEVDEVQRLRPSKRENRIPRIGQLVSDSEGVVRLTPTIDDPTTVLVQALKTGTVRLELTTAPEPDEKEGRTEIIDIGVRPKTK